MSSDLCDAWRDSINRCVVVRRIEHGVVRTKTFSEKSMIMEPLHFIDIENDLRLEHRVAYLQPAVVGH